MRYIKASIVPLFLLLLITTALPASASDDFEGWAMKRSNELDGRWARAAAREVGTATESSARRTMTISRKSTTISAGRKAGRPSSTAAGNSSGIDGSRFTKRGGQKFLWKSTRDRNGASRGVSKLTSPSQYTRASASKRRLPGNNSQKYRRSVSSGRAGAWRKSARMGTRISTSGKSTRRRSSASSTMRGATRVRRSATRR